MGRKPKASIARLANFRHKKDRSMPCHRPLMCFDLLKKGTRTVKKCKNISNDLSDNTSSIETIEDSETESASIEEIEPEDFEIGER